MTFRHVVLLRWNAGTPQAQHDAVVARLRELPAAISSIRHYEIGSDERETSGNFDLVVVADFDDRAGYLEYASHPVHLDVITELIRPILAERAAVQHVVE